MFSILEKFQKLTNSLSITVRYASRYHQKHNKKFLYDRNDAVKIEKTINYYPRRRDEIKTEAVQQQEELPVSKLFRVSRIKVLKGKPYWERRILRDFNLFDKGAVAIVKNIPENNARLWKIKHLVKIEPIVFKYGEPTEKDINYTYLKENGECVVIKNVESLDKRLEATQNFEKDKKQLNSDVLKKDSRLKWLNNY